MAKKEHLLLLWRNFTPKLMFVSSSRRLTPDFKVRVEVRYRGRVSFPLTVRAHILSQQEKDNLPEWTPEGMMDDNLPYGKAQCQMGMNPKSILVSIRCYVLLKMSCTYPFVLNLTKGI